MKKLLNLIAVVLIATSSVFAQTAAPAATQKKQTKKVETKVSSTAKAPLKKDGTPDMRFKANKETKVVTAGPKKKDGTADMRYKANKAAKKN